VAAYVGLTKPRVIELLLLTTVPVMFFAAGGIPDLGLVVATVVGGALSAGSASALNCVYDRDIDEQMRRTRRRAIPRHIVTPRAALTFGVVLGVLATVILYVWVNPLSSLLSVLAECFYLFVYTMLLKRRTTQNIVWGGLAGCFPALIGWTAVTATSRGHRWCCSSWCSSGPRRTPGRWRCATARTTRVSTCRCCRWWRRPRSWAGRS